MVLFNYSTKELTAKIVYYGPGLCGKTTNLQFIHENLPGNVKGKMLSLATKTDRTLFFDFLPIDLGEIRGMKTRVQLYTVPGQVFYNETRKLVLKGADGIVFVADSQQQMMGANAESFKNLEDNLKAHGMTLAEMPHVIQFNKRDLPKVASVEELNAGINHFNAPFYESVATTGIGVQDTLKAITKLVLLHLTKKYDPKAVAATPKAVAPRPAPAAPPAARIPTPPVRPMADGIPLSVDAVVEPPAPAPAVRAAVTPVPLADVDAVDPSFGDDEIDDLVHEVGETQAEPAAAATATAIQDDVVGDLEIELPDVDDDGSLDAAVPVPPDSHVVDMGAPALAAADDGAPIMGGDSYEIDRQLDPDFDAAAGIDAPLSEPADPSVAPSIDDAPLTLDDVVSPADLFDSPEIDVAQIAPGGERHIVIPVVVGDTAGATRRYTLTVRLRLDPVD